LFSTICLYSNRPILYCCFLSGSWHQIVNISARDVEEALYIYMEHVVGFGIKMLLRIACYDKCIWVEGYWKQAIRKCIIIAVFVGLCSRLLHVFAARSCIYGCQLCLGCLANIGKLILIGYISRALQDFDIKTLVRF